MNWAAWVAWFKDNKDVLVAMGGLITPAVAFVAALVSYRAVVTGPRIQLEIASRQLALQEKIASANLLGAVDQKWIEDFRETFIELHGSWQQLATIKEVQQEPRNAGFQVEKTVELQRRNFGLMCKILLLVEDGQAGAHLMKLLNTYHADLGTPGDIKASAEASAQALRIIQQKQEGIAARIAAVEQGKKASDSPQAGT